jgi:putative DNA primase/helicase
MKPNDAVGAFKDAIRQRGLVPPTLIQADGRIHRIDAEGKGGRGDGAYLLHADFPPSGGFQNFRDGEGWQNWRADAGRRLTPEESRILRQRIEAERRQREADEAARQGEARAKATALWGFAEPCASHPYLVRKGVGAHGVRLHRGRLVVPLRDAGGTLHSLQFIDGDGSKRFLTGGRVQGCFHLVGEPGGVIGVAEGYATASSCHEATGWAVAAAMDCGNLKAVILALHATYPAASLVVFADDDWKTEGNPGLTKSRLAASAVGGLVAIPDFGEDREDGESDFNDYFQRRRRLWEESGVAR